MVFHPAVLITGSDASVTVIAHACICVVHLSPHVNLRGGGATVRGVSMDHSV